MVPEAVRNLIWKHYRPGQEIDNQPSLEYIMTAFVSISCVALKEGQPLPKLTQRLNSLEFGRDTLPDSESVLREDQESAS
jgi:hypothetical protein